MRREASPREYIATYPASPDPFGYATHLSCRECGHTGELGAQHACAECFGPLEVGYDLPAADPGGDRGRTAQHLAVRQPAAGPARRRHPAEHRAGLDPADPGRPAGGALGMRALWVKDERGNPTHSFKDRVVAVALAAASELGFKVLACPSTGNLANAVAAAAARAGIRSVVLIPADLEPQKIIGTAVYGGTLVTVDGSYDDVNRLASELADERDDWAFVNVNVRPYYAEGSKTIGFEIAEQLGWRLPRADRRPGGVGRAAGQDRQGVPRAGGARPGRGHALPGVRRPGHRLLAGRGRVPGRPRRGPAGPAQRRSPSRWRSATRPTARTCSTWCAAPAARSPTSATTRSWTRSGCSPPPRASSARPRAGSRWP